MAGEMFGPTKYDDLNWHADAAVEAGQPPEHAFAHIGLYLGWLIRHGLEAPRMWPADHLAAVRSGEMTGSDLADDCDHKLISDMLGPEGAAFSDARYSAYLDAFGDLLEDARPYGIVDDAATYPRVEPVLDALYAAWVADGRPKAEPEEHPEVDAMFDGLLANAPFDVEAPSIGQGRTAIRLDADGAWRVEALAVPHAAPDLEALVPDELVGPDAQRTSATAADWGSSLLNRALRRLGVSPGECQVASVMGGPGESFLGVTLYRLPGVPAARLADEFGEVIHRPSRRPWEPAVLGGRSVMAAEDANVAHGSGVAWWAIDGLVVHAFGSGESLAAAARLLP